MDNESAMSDYEHVEVLLVEDNKLDAEMTIRALRKAKFLNQLHWVKDGVEALEFLKCQGQYSGRDPNERPKLILLDLKMPRLDGFDVLRELKSNEHTRSIPVVAMTSSDQERDIAECYRLGANGYVKKPVQLPTFMQAVANIGTYWLLVNEAP